MSVLVFSVSRFYPCTKSFLYKVSNIQSLFENMKAPEEHNTMKVTMKNRNKINKVNKVNKVMYMYLWLKLHDRAIVITCMHIKVMTSILINTKQKCLHLRHITRKQDTCLRQNKDTDQMHKSVQLINVFSFRCTDSTMVQHPNQASNNLQYSWVCINPVHNPKNRFYHVVAQFH